MPERSTAERVQLFAMRAKLAGRAGPPSMQTACAVPIANWPSSCIPTPPPSIELLSGMGADTTNCTIRTEEITP